MRSKLITEEVINNLSTIVRQNQAIKSVLNSINMLRELKPIEFESGHPRIGKKGINKELLFKISNLYNELEDAVYEKF